MDKDNFFPADAGNEYATPYSDFRPPFTGIWREYVGPDTAVPATLNWGATEVGWKPAIIPIINDDRVEFSEDMVVQLWQEAGDTGFIGVNNTAHLNILADQFQGMRVNNGFVEIGEQPAGAADRTFNPANQEQTDPPNNTLPGANNTVHTTLVQPADGKVIIGGDFT
ncbi:hypothetical protein, partial [Emticicia sp.]|uniref:hypothetical protein n=1 Tax=Emticicia sp. TaxID=1930953 RepID=UPI0037532C54